MRPVERFFRVTFNAFQALGSHPFFFLPPSFLRHPSEGSGSMRLVRPIRLPFAITAASAPPRCLPLFLRHPSEGSGSMRLVRPIRLPFAITAASAPPRCFPPFLCHPSEGWDPCVS